MNQKSGGFKIAQKERFLITFCIFVKDYYKHTNMRAELQNQNRVNVDYEKTTGPIFLKFWHKFLLQSTIEIQK